MGNSYFCLYISGLPCTRSGISFTRPTEPCVRKCAEATRSSKTWRATKNADDLPRRPSSVLRLFTAATPRRSRNRRPLAYIIIILWYYRPRPQSTPYEGYPLCLYPTESPLTITLYTKRSKYHTPLVAGCSGDIILF